MKRFILIPVLGLILFAAPVFAGPGAMGFGGDGMMGRPGMMSGQDKPDPDEARLITRFREDTKALRREMMVKRMRMRALMRAEAPDDVKVGKLAGELFDLQDQLRKKAAKAGVPVSACGQACGMDHGGRGMMGGGKGMMGQRSRGHHRMGGDM